MKVWTYTDRMEIRFEEYWKSQGGAWDGTTWKRERPWILEIPKKYREHRIPRVFFSSREKAETAMKSIEEYYAANGPIKSKARLAREQAATTAAAVEEARIERTRVSMEDYITLQMRKAFNIGRLDDQHGPVYKLPPLFPPTDRSRTITLDRLAELTGIKESSLRNWLKPYGKGIPGAFRNGPGDHWKFHRALIEPWWEQLISQHVKKSGGQMEKTGVYPYYPNQIEPKLQDVHDVHFHIYLKGEHFNLFLKQLAQLVDRSGVSQQSPAP
jgi:hypothetical protein